MNLPHSGNRTYIGDGVYVQRDKFDPCQIWLQAERDGRLHEIALGPREFRDLKSFVEIIWPTKPGLDP